MNGRKILWVSAHEPLDFELAELKRIFGPETELARDRSERSSYLSAEEIVRRFREGGHDEMFVVLPLSVIEKIIELGIKPIKAEVKQLPTSEGADFSWRGRHFKFLKFVRITGIRVETEDI